VSRQPDAVVVGAGIVGAACALALAREGLRVLSLDDDFAGGGAPAAGMGHLVVMDDSEPQMALTSYSLRLWRELAPELPADCEDDPCGTLWLADGPEEMAQVEAKARYYRAHGVTAEVLDAAQLTAAEPHLRSGLAGALRVPGDRVIYPPNAARFLLARAADHGAQLWERFHVSQLGSGFVDGHGERITAPIIVNAAGAAAPGLTPGLPIVPRKGHLVITDRYPGLCRHQLVELGYLKSAHSALAGSPAHSALAGSSAHGALAGSSADEALAGSPAGAPTYETLAGSPADGAPAGSRSAGALSPPISPLSAANPAGTVAFNLQPRATGQILLGSSRELAGWDARLNHALVSRMIARALAFLPRLGAAKALRSWVGFRPATPDHLPLIGAWPEVPGLWIAGGHEGLGITTSLATGRLLADLICGRQPAIDCAPYAPGRVQAAGGTTRLSPPSQASPAPPGSPRAPSSPSDPFPAGAPDR
jgi:glycine/D-amino acid oxidase-like deaminating enzyme